jgi:hypothetical protein
MTAADTFQSRPKWRHVFTRNASTRTSRAAVEAIRTARTLDLPGA